MAAVATTVVALTACSSATGGSGRHGSSSTATTGTVSCDWTPDTQPAARRVTLPQARVPSTDAAAVAMRTNRGTLALRLDVTAAPCTVASFLSLARQKFFDATPCHRLTTAGIFVLQCGDPTGTGTGGPGYTIPDEVKGAQTYPAGTLAMANTGSPHSGGSQFFIVYADTNLPPQYTVFGTVTTGLSVVQAVARAGSDNSFGAGDGKPRLPVTIESVTEG